jgi:NADH-quinone oxidoreductase subunit H
MREQVPSAVTGGWLVPATVLASLVLVLLGAATLVLDGVLDTRDGKGTGRRALTRPFDELARLLRQRRRVTVAADALLWRTGGAGLVVAALLMVAVTPVGEHVLVGSDIGVVWFNAVDVAVWCLVWLVGWGANAAYPLVAGYRFLALGLAYELPLMFALVAPAVGARSLDAGVIAAAQDRVWFVVWMPVAFVVYCIGVLGFSVSGPFASPVGGDVAGGVLAELSGVDRLLVLAGRRALLVAGAAFAVPLFLGGGSGPLLPAWAWTLVKVVALLAVLVWARRRLPTLRPDLFMEVGWVVLLPAVLLQDLVVAVVAVWRA